MAFTEDLRSQVDIDASPEEVWGILTTFGAFPEWNPFIVSIQGEPAVGERLRARLQPPGGRGITLKPKVTAAEPGQTFAWLGRLGVPGVFDGAHRFELEPLAGGRTRLVQSEHFSGVLVPMVRRSLRTHTLAGFEAMNRALREQVEAA